MAVRVIKKGPAREVKKVIICNECGATLEYVPNDVHEYHGLDYSGGPDGQEWINCPQCKKQVIICSW